MRKQLKNYLVPHEENDHQPHLLRNKATWTIVAIACAIELIILLIIVPTRPGVLTEKLNSLAAIFPSVLVEKTNKERVKELENELTISPDLVLAAQLKANDMAEKGYFAHNSPDGKTPWYWLQEAGYAYETAGENLAVNFVDSTDVHNAWMDSPTHKANIVREGFTEIGIATAEGTYKGKKAIFVAQFFGAPSSRADRFAQNTGGAVAVATLDPRISTSTVGQVATTSEVLGAEIAQVTDNPDAQPTTAEVTQEQSAENRTIVGSVTATTTLVAKLLTSPKNTVSVLLWAIALLIVVALCFKVFIKPKIQYSQLISNGLVILFLIVLFTLLNQHLLRWFAAIV